VRECNDGVTPLTATPPSVIFTITHISKRKSKRDHVADIDHFPVISSSVKFRLSRKIEQI
jgi:hypothetical protein